MKNIKDVKYSLTFWWIITFVAMFLSGIFGGIIWDKSDWIFLVLVVSILVLNVKLNKILKKKK